MEMRDKQANITDVLVVASNQTGPVAFGPTIASSSEQVSLREPILNQPTAPLMHLALTPNMSTGL